MSRVEPHTGHDPLEGVNVDGTIATGAQRSRIADEFKPVLAVAGLVSIHDAVWTTDRLPLPTDGALSGQNLQTLSPLWLLGAMAGQPRRHR